MRDQISADLAVDAVRASPAIAGSAAAAVQGWALADVAVLLTIAYTVILMSTTVVRNWGMWMDWWRARIATVVRFWRWIRG